MERVRATGAEVAAGRLRAVPAAATVVDTVATTKLTAPAQGPDIVVPPALLKRATALVASHRLTLLVAQGGSGKTTLVGAVSDQLAGPVAWIRLHPSDDDPYRLVELLAAATARAGSRDTTSMCAALLGSGEARAFGLHQLLGALVNDLAAAAPLTVVLDDLDVLRAGATAEAVEYVLDFAPAEVRFVATARRPPTVRVGRLRSQGAVAELNTRDLRLDLDTATDLLERLGHDVDRENARALVEWSNGWIAGFLLAARTHAGVPPEVSLAPDGLEEYLDQEVLDRQPERTRRFLQEVSLLEELDPIRCATLTGVDDAESLLHDLRSDLGFFVEDEVGRLRLHDLFAEHLRRSLRRDRSPAELADLHRRAATSALDPLEGVEHLLAAGDHEEAAVHLEGFGRAWSRNPTHDPRLRSLIDRVDPAVRARRPWLDLVVGIAGADELAGAGSAELLLSVIERADDHDDFELRWLATSAATLATHDLSRWGPEMGRMEADPRFAQLTTYTRVKWHITAAWGALWADDLDRARRCVHTAIAEQADGGDLAATDTLVLHLGFPLAAWPGAVAEFAAQHRWAAATFPDIPEVRLGAHAHLSALSTLQGEPPPAPELHPAELDLLRAVPFWSVALGYAEAARARRAGDHLGVQRAVESTMTGPARPFALLLLPLLASSCREHGHTDALRELRAQLEEWRGGPPGESAVTLLGGFVDAQLAWAEGRLEEARAALEHVDHGAIPIVAPVLDPGVERALLLAERNQRLATAVLGERLAVLVGRHGCPGRVADSGPGLVPVLRDLADDHARRVLAVLEAPAPHVPRTVPDTGETLSSREVEVLGLLAQGRSNARIAEELYVSVNTVKTHVKRVLMKLGASSRSDAVARARVQHLL